MKRTIIEVDRERGISQWTYPDERWYSRRVNENTEWDFVPSVTWIASFYPRGVGFYKWLASKGWDEAEEIKAAAGDKGSKVHQGIGVLLAGGTVEMESEMENPRSLELEPLTPSEYECLMSFRDWFREVKPEVIDFEYTVWNERYRYAGTIDLKCRIKGKVWIIDVKTSPDIWPPYELQVSAYKHADVSLPKAQRLGILQVGYKRNKKQKWKFTQIPDQFRLFLAARMIWTKEASNQKPLQREYPLSLSLVDPVVENLVEVVTV